MYMVMTSVEFPGPPLVRAFTESNSFSAFMMHRAVMVWNMLPIIGMVILKKVWILLAPSTLALSYTSDGML